MYAAVASTTAGSLSNREPSCPPAKKVSKNMTTPKEKEIPCAINKERTARSGFPAPIF